jgi:hypothetical protein
MLVIFHNMIIESERGDPATRDGNMYDNQCSLAIVDHQMPA